MPKGRKAKPPSRAKAEQGVATYFLAKHSGLFRPGVATILANSPMTAKSQRTLLPARPKYLGLSGPGGGSGGTIAGNIAPTGSVIISGTATQGQTLTASNTLSDPNGMGVVGYQWKRDGIVIVGATGSTYLLVAGDVGHTISVTASYVDGLGTTESVASSSTTTVAASFSPSTGLTGLIGWWDMQVPSSIIQSGGVVTNLADQSGAGNHLGDGSTSYKPAYSATGINSYPAMVFTASLSQVISAALAFSMGAGNTLTVFGVALLNSGVGNSNYGRLINYIGAGTDTTSAASWSLFRDATNPQIDFGRNNVPVLSSMSYAIPHRIIATINSSGLMTLYLDGVASTTATSAGNWITSGILRVGSDLTSYWNGNIGELGVATGFSNAATVASLDTYLKNKWGL